MRQFCPMINEGVRHNVYTVPGLDISAAGTELLTHIYGDAVNGIITESFLNVGGDSSAAAVAKLNGDANNDLAVVVQPLLGQTVVKAFTGDGFGTFTTAGSSGVGGIPQRLLARDLGDAAPIDLVSVDTSS